MKTFATSILTVIFSIQTCFATTQVNRFNSAAVQRQNIVTLLNSFKTPADMIEFNRKFLGTNEAEAATRLFQENSVKLTAALPKFSLAGDQVQVAGSKEVLITFATNRVDQFNRQGKEFQFDAKKSFTENLKAIKKIFLKPENHASHFKLSKMFFSEAFAKDDITKNRDENMVGSVLGGAAVAAMASVIGMLAIMLGTIAGLTMGPVVLGALALGAIAAVIFKISGDYSTDSNYKQFAFNCPKNRSGNASLNLGGNDINIQFDEGKVINYDVKVGDQKTTYFVDRDWNPSGIQTGKITEFPLHSRQYTKEENDLLVNLKTLLQVCAHPDILAKVQKEMARVQDKINSNNSTTRQPAATETLRGH